MGKFRGINYSQRALRNALYEGTDHYERDNADAAPGTVVKSGGSAPFDATFDLQILTVYFTVAAGVYTLRTAAYVLANAATLANRLAFFTFSQADFCGGFAKVKGQFPLVNWSYGSPFIYGNGFPNTTFGDLDATALAQLQVGDMVQPFTATVAGPVNYVALVIIRCANVAYGTLLASTNSDSFIVNKIRYVQNDTSAAGLAQFNNPVQWQKLSLFGQYGTDNLAPVGQKSPNQFQNGIIDLDVTKAITKEIGFASYLNYDAVNLLWTVYVKVVNKLPVSL